MLLVVQSQVLQSPATGCDSIVYLDLTVIGTERNQKNSYQFRVIRLANLSQKYLTQLPVIHGLMNILYFLAPIAILFLNGLDYKYLKWN